jgi:hypothetical protein
VVAVVSQNIGYVYEIAGMMIAAERRGEDSSVIRDTAIGNRVTEDQLQSARATLLGLLDTSDEALADYSYRTYVKDGLENGYINPGEEDAHSVWVLGQMAVGHHGH